jgi:hypothetical protein
MSASDRQNRLLVAEDWKKIYQSYENADFQSYDFENIRRVMINYIRENYPEDFNDYIESSEFLAVLDLVAFLSQSFSFRVDLNARENFLDTAERRDSILRLARLLSYKVKRNIPSNGFLKFSAVSTSEQVFDSNSRDLANQTIFWNDSSNPDWYDQFIRVVNAALPATRQFGNPDNKDVVLGIPTEQYRFQTSSTGVPVYKFNKIIDGRAMDFEIVSTVFKGANDIFEEPPKQGNKLAFLYRDDGKGNGSSNTGFFLHFRQGNLAQGTFTVDQPTTDETVDINTNNINNSDIWLYRLDKNNVESELWTQVPAFENNNVIYNSLDKSVKNLYGVITRANDQVSLIFSDGVFGNIPLGSFRTYYRTSNGLRYTINPRDIRNITISIPYVSNLGKQEQITITLSLQSSVVNSSPSESNESIKARAPSTYYTQNRMITAEDYNISPLTANQEVIKIKSINRTSSGISRYFDLVDPTGKYSKTNLFADDGVLYQEKYFDTFRFKYQSRSDIEKIIYNEVIPKLKDTDLKNFYYGNFSKISLVPLNSTWTAVTIDTNQTTGFIKDKIGVIEKVGVFTTSSLKYFTVGFLVKFKAPVGQYFDITNNNELKTGIPTTRNTTDNIWATVVSVRGDGTNNKTGVTVDNQGTIKLNQVIPTGAVLDEVIPSWRTTLDLATINSMVDLIFSNKPFGLRYDIDSRTWKIITETNLNTFADFNLSRQGDLTNQRADSSWLLLFTTDTDFYTVTTRLQRYIFESDKQIRFFYDDSDKVYDIKNNKTVKDVIKILNINNKPSSNEPFTYDRDWEISEQYVGLDGYVDSKKIQVTFFDGDDDGVVDDPTLFDQLVDFFNQNIINELKYIILEKYVISQGQEDYRYVKNTGQVLFFNSELDSNLNLQFRNDGQCFYFLDTRTVKKFNKNKGILEASLDYKVYPGRDDIKFQYIHSADYESRIDPGLTNIIDLYVLTKQYDINFRQWLNGSTDEEPLPLSTADLSNILSPDLNRIKTISDEIVYHPAKYKILFGKKAKLDVQATFKIIKNKESVVSDNDVRTRVLSAINEFFALENWDFGENFYFSELSAYVMKQLAPDIVNIVIVPKKNDLSFGSLFEIKAEKDQIFVNGATIDEIEVVQTLTPTSLRSAGTIVSQAEILNTQFINSTRSI